MVLARPARRWLILMTVANILGHFGIGMAAAVGRNPGAAAEVADSRSLTLNRALDAEPESLDPQLIHTIAGMRIANDLFEGLVHRAADAAIEAGVAKEWTTSIDGLHWTFVLRQTKWSNGQPVTAADFVAAWRRAVTRATGSPSAWCFVTAGIKNAQAVIDGTKEGSELGVQALSANTLRITLQRPSPWLLELLVLPVFFPLPTQQFDAHGGSWASMEPLVSNGAYRLKKRVLHEVLSFEFNPHYADQPPSVRQVNWYLQSSDKVAFDRYRVGELDMTLGVPVHHIGQLRDGTESGQLRTSHLLGTEYYAFNTRRAPFDKPALRRALLLALNRQQIADKVLNGGATAAVGFVPPYTAGLPDNWPATEQQSLQDRLKEAKRLYHAAGYSDEKPLKVTLLYNSNNTLQRVAIAASAMWKKHLGAEVTLQTADSKTLIERSKRGSFDIIRASWVADFNDPVSMLHILGSQSSNNKAGYRSVTYDTLLKKLQVTGEQRHSALLRLKKVLENDAPVIPLYHYATPQLISPRVKGWYDDPQGIVMSRYLSIAPSGR